MLRDLLDPRGVHGQGEIFLRLFLQIIGLGHLMIGRNVAINCEEQTTRCQNLLRRMDIFLCPDNSFGIGTENKPWAGDQKGWVKDY
jgi:PD-(D/E)XK nuclease superfamily